MCLCRWSVSFFFPPRRPDCELGLAVVRPGNHCLVESAGRTILFAFGGVRTDKANLSHAGMAVDRFGNLRLGGDHMRRRALVSGDDRLHSTGEFALFPADPLPLVLSPVLPAANRQCVVLAS